MGIAAQLGYPWDEPEDNWATLAKDYFFPVRVDIPNRKGQFFAGEIGQRNVTYRKHVALQCKPVFHFGEK